MARKGTRKLRTYRQARRREWLLSTLTEIAALEGRLRLTTEEARATFYGPEYLDPAQRLSRLLDAVGVQEASL